MTAPDSLQEFIARLNHVRQQSPALQRNDTLRFHEIQNENMLAYTKTDPSGDNVIVVVVNLDPPTRRPACCDCRSATSA